MSREKGSRLTQAEDSSWPEPELGIGERKKESAWEEERDSIQHQPAERKRQRGGRAQEGAKAEAGDRGRNAGQPEISGQADGKGWRARPRGRKRGEEAAKGQEQMRAAGVLNRAQDTENGNKEDEYIFFFFLNKQSLIFAFVSIIHGYLILDTLVY